MIIIDDIERVIEYVSVGLRFSNVSLQSLLVLAKALPPPGHRLMIVGTTAIPDMLESMEVLSAFQLTLRLPMLVEAAQYAAVLASVEPGMRRADVTAVAAHLAGKEVGIKKLLTVLDMARQNQQDAGATGPLSGDSIMQALVEWGL
jgi:vesicle-fusing ATPase